VFTPTYQLVHAYAVTVIVTESTCERANANSLLDHAKFIGPLLGIGTCPYEHDFVGRWTVVLSRKNETQV